MFGGSLRTNHQFVHEKMWPDHHRDYTASHVEKVSFESHEKWGTQPTMGNK